MLFTHCIYILMYTSIRLSLLYSHLASNDNKFPLELFYIQGVREKRKPCFSRRKIKLRCQEPSLPECSAGGWDQISVFQSLPLPVSNIMSRILIWSTRKRRRAEGADGVRRFLTASLRWRHLLAQL